MKKLHEKENTDIEIFAKLRNSKEKKLAKLLLYKYLEHFDIENISDRGTLGQLIYLEVMQFRLQDKMNELHGKEARAIPIDFLEVFHKNADSILKMKVSLGLTKSKEKQSTYDALQHLMKRFEKYGSENQGSRHLKCPHGFKLILLRIRTDAWTAQKHPFFRDTFLYNRALIDNYNKTITLTRDFLAEVFETSPDYVDWITNKIKKTGAANGKEANQEVEQKREVVELI